MANPSFAVGGDVTLYPQRGISQGVGVGSQSYDAVPRFPVNQTMVGTPIGNPTPPGAIEGRVAGKPPTSSLYNKSFQYQKASGAALPPDAENKSGYFNRTGTTIPKNMYFWAIKG